MKSIIRINQITLQGIPLKDDKYFILSTLHASLMNHHPLSLFHF